jgi:hypothetical protein
VPVVFFGGAVVSGLRGRPTVFLWPWTPCVAWLVALGVAWLAGHEPMSSRFTLKGLRWVRGVSVATALLLMVTWLQVYRHDGGIEDMLGRAFIDQYSTSWVEVDDPEDGPEEVKEILTRQPGAWGVWRRNRTAEILLGLVGIAMSISFAVGGATGYLWTTGALEKRKKRALRHVWPLDRSRFCAACDRDLSGLTGERIGRDFYCWVCYHRRQRGPSTHPKGTR